MNNKIFIKYSDTKNCIIEYSILIIINVKKEFHAKLTFYFYLLFKAVFINWLMKNHYLKKIVYFFKPFLINKIE